MSVLSNAVGVCRAECTACGEIFERSLEAGGETVSPEDNQDILERVARNHEHRCPESGEGWSETVDVDVELDMTGGE